MSKKKTETENGRAFSDLTNKAWFKDGETIKIGDSFPSIMNGDSQAIEAKEVLSGNPFRTWKIVIDKEDRIYLLKSSKELK